MSVTQHNVDGLDTGSASVGPDGPSIETEELGQFESFVAGSNYDAGSDGYVYVFDVGCTIDVDDGNDYHVLYVGETADDLENRFRSHFQLDDLGRWPNDHHNMSNLGCLGHYKSDKKRLITINQPYSIDALRTIVNVPKYHIDTESDFKTRLGWLEDRVIRHFIGEGYHVIDDHDWSDADIPDELPTFDG